jgi:DNA-directed RNA polymerase subunit E'/Rpb7
MKRQIVRKSVEYIPDLNHPLDALLEKFQEKYTHTCSKDYGFVLRVIRIVRVLSNRISIYNAKMIVECEIEIECLLPVSGEVFQGTIQQIFPQGIIVQVDQAMKGFIPSPKHVYEKQQTISFRVIQTRFQKGKYDCIGEEIQT